MFHCLLYYYDNNIASFIEDFTYTTTISIDWLSHSSRTNRKEEGDASKTGGKKKKGKKAKPEVEEELIKYIVKVLKMDDFKEAPDAGHKILFSGC